MQWIMSSWICCLTIMYVAVGQWNLLFHQQIHPYSFPFQSVFQQLTHLVTWRFARNLNFCMRFYLWSWMYSDSWIMCRSSGWNRYIYSFLGGNWFLYWVDGHMLCLNIPCHGNILNGEVHLTCPFAIPVAGSQRHTAKGW